MLFIPCIRVDRLGAVTLCSDPVQRDRQQHCSGHVPACQESKQLQETSTGATVIDNDALPCTTWRIGCSITCSMIVLLAEVYHDVASASIRHKCNLLPTVYACKGLKHITCHDDISTPNSVPWLYQCELHVITDDGPEGMKYVLLTLASGRMDV